MDRPIRIKFKKLFPDARAPVFSTEGAAGADLFAYIPRDENALYSRNMADPVVGEVEFPTGGKMQYDKGPFARIYPGDRKVIGAGIAVEIPPGYEAQIRPRSGLALKKGISIVNAPGTIDSDYRGEIGAILINHGKESFDVCLGDRIAQLVVKPVPKVEFIEFSDLTETKRGDGAFGSTGVKS